MENVKEYLLNNEDKLLDVTQQLNGWDGSLEHLQFYENDEYTINELFPNSYEMARSITYGDYNFNDDYFKFDGYGNIETYDQYEMVQEHKDYIDDIVDSLKDNYENIDIDDELLDLIESNLDIEKEGTSLDDLIKGAVEKTKDQPAVGSKNLDMER